MSIDDKIPPINTTVRGNDIFELNVYSDYKFVQLYVEEKPYLRIGSCRDVHLIILLNFFRECNEHGMPIYFEEEIQSIFDKYINSLDGPKKELPSLKTDKYQVVGMGIVSLLAFSSEKTMIFGGDSMDFGISTDRQHIEKIKQYLSCGWEARISEQ